MIRGTPAGLDASMPFRGSEGAPFSGDSVTPKAAWHLTELTELTEPRCVGKFASVLLRRSGRPWICQSGGPAVGVMSGGRRLTELTELTEPRCAGGCVSCVSSVRAFTRTAGGCRWGGWWRWVGGSRGGRGSWVMVVGLLLFWALVFRVAADSRVFPGCSVRGRDRLLF